ncbi:hypothetical protein M758_4G111400 [Ceratodon purpureus]|uniref:Globin domain-containing protein n=1 Tax=Ceratodon purpureus TaxID=3225 RepID=A0A8T0I7W0_CERPU|nr:hypothetical protein KC19_4G111900 [Ceratodon purpureus]KAG0619046.1 hypothetical protein M758_4G111400 [Ceratodon purpureus]
MAQDTPVSFVPVAGDANPAPKVYSKESVQLVKQSWAILSKDAQANAVAFFKNVFEIAPAAKGFFYFMQDTSVPFEQNPKLKSHALQVFRLTGDAAAQLGDKGAYEILESRLHKLAAKHLSKGVQDAHFEVVKEALLQTIEEGLPELWSPALKSAWADAYDALATILKNEMHAQAAAATKAEV